MRAVNRELALLARELKLLGGDLVAIDGAFFHGDASKASILTEKRLKQQMAAVDRSIAEYEAALDVYDQAEDVTAATAPSPAVGEEMAQKLAALSAAGGGKHGQIVAGYSVQIAVDDQHQLIVASEVANHGNDTGQLYAMAAAAKEALGAEALTVVADGGHYNGETLKECEDAAITAYIRPPDRDQRLKR